MAIIAKTLTNGTLTVISNSGSGTEIFTARNDHPKWSDILTAYKMANDARLETLLSLKAVMEEYSVGEVSVNTSGVTFRGSPLHTVDADRVMAFLRDGLPYEPIANYIEKKMQNPSARAIQEMYNFLEHKAMPLTSNGNFIAYKGVNLEFWSINGNKDTRVIQGTVNDEGKLLNKIGDTIEVERSSVDDNYTVGCSFGLHAGSLAYAKGWGHRVVLVEINPADVVSVPSDCECQKLRCCKYKVIGEYTGPMPDTYTKEFDDADDSNVDDDDICPECGNHNNDCSCDDCSDCGNPDGDCTCEDYCSGCDRHNDDCICNDHCPGCGKYINDCICNNSSSICQSNNPECDALGHITHSNSKEEAPKTALEQAAVDSGILEGNQVSQPYESDNNFSIGMNDGRADKVLGKISQYRMGDETGADSTAHSNYIKGYFYGYGIFS